MYLLIVSANRKSDFRFANILQIFDITKTQIHIAIPGLLCDMGVRGGVYYIPLHIIL